MSLADMIGGKNWNYENRVAALLVDEYAPGREGARRYPPKCGHLRFVTRQCVMKLSFVTRQNVICCQYFTH